MIITAVSVWVDSCNLAIGRILRYRRNTPSIVGVSRYNLASCVGNGDNVTLQILDEIVGRAVVDDTANTILVVIERNKRIAIPYLAENLGAVQRVGMLYTVNSLRGTDTIGIVGVGVSVEGFKLTVLYHFLCYLSRKTPHLKNGVRR